MNLGPAASAGKRDGGLDESEADQLRQLVAQVVADTSPEYRRTLQQLQPGVRTGQAFALWRIARSALVRQGLRRGLGLDEAEKEAADRLIAQADDAAAP